MTDISPHPVVVAVKHGKHFVPDNKSRGKQGKYANLRRVTIGEEQNESQKEVTMTAKTPKGLICESHYALHQKPLSVHLDKLK